MTHVCSNCHEEYPDKYNWIEIESPRITIRNNGDSNTFVADGLHFFCGIPCLNTYLMKIASDDDEI